MLSYVFSDVFLISAVGQLFVHHGYVHIAVLNNSFRCFARIGIDQFDAFINLYMYI